VAVIEAGRVERTARRGSGWLAFAATMMFLSGCFKVLDALWAFKYDDDVDESVQTVIFEADLAAWGWVWLVVGVALLFAAIFVVNGSESARWIGIVIAAIAAITFFPWIYYVPLWTILSVALAGLVIYALVAYGGRRSDPQEGEYGHG
jgi:hypothetical protein